MPHASRQHQPPTRGLGSVRKDAGLFAYRTSPAIAGYDHAGFSFSFMRQRLADARPALSTKVPESLQVAFPRTNSYVLYTCLRAASNQLGVGTPVKANAPHSSSSRSRGSQTPGLT
jgi:hypothetical protein